MSALPQPPLDYPSNVVTMQHAPRHVTSKGEADYVSYMVKKVQAKNERIEYLEEQIGYLKTDFITAALAVVLLLVTNGIVLYQWLVVCNGQAPAGF